MNQVLSFNRDDGCNGGIKARLQENTDTLKEDKKSSQLAFPPPVNLHDVTPFL